MTKHFRITGCLLCASLFSSLAYGQADSQPKMLGDRDLTVIISPLSRDKRAKNPRQTKAPEPPPDEKPVSGPPAP